MCAVSVGSTLIQPNLCTFFQSAHPHPTRCMHAFQSAQPQSNPIYVCCFGRVNPNPTRFMHIFSISQSQSNQIYACFFGWANLIYVCCFGWVNPNPTRFMHIFSIGPPPSNLIYVCFSIGPTPIQTFTCIFSVRRSRANWKIHEFPHPIQMAAPNYYTRYASAHPSMTGYITGISWVCWPHVQQYIMSLRLSVLYGTI